MKVCIISSIFSPHSRGGAETVASACALMFAKTDEVVVITAAPWQGVRSLAGKWEELSMRTPPNLPSERARSACQGRKIDFVSPPARGGVRGGGSPIRIFRFTPFNLFSIFNIANYPAFLRLIWHVMDMCNLHTYLVVRKILRQEKPDLIMTHNLKGLGYTVPLAIRRQKSEILSQKWIHTVHDMALLHPTGLRMWGKENSFMHKNSLVSFYSWCCKKLFGSPEVVIYPSRFLWNEYRSRGFFKKSKTAVVKNPVTSESVPNVPKAPNIQTLGASQFRFLYLGQLESYKGIKLLLNVWREFSAAHTTAELLIAGDGSMREEVARDVRQLARVRYIGFVPQDQLDALFSLVQCTVLPSLAYENSPTTIGESMTFGVPVVASRLGGIPELIEDGVDGFLFEPGNEKALYQAMEQVLQSNPEQMRKNTREKSAIYSVINYRHSLDELCGNPLS